MYSVTSLLQTLLKNKRTSIIATLHDPATHNVDKDIILLLVVHTGADPGFY